MDFNGAFEWLRARCSGLEGGPVADAVTLYLELCRQGFTDGPWVLLVDAYEDDESEETRIELQMQLFDDDDPESVGIAAVLTGDVPASFGSFNIYGALPGEESSAQGGYVWHEFVERVDSALKPLSGPGITLSQVDAF